MKILSVLAMLMFFVLGVQAQKTTKNGYTGNWTDNNTWTVSPALGLTGLGNPSIVVNGYVTVGAPGSTTDLEFVGPAANSITIQDTLVIFGSMKFATDAVTLRVTAGSFLIIFGDLDINNKVDISSSGNIIVMGQFKLTGGQADVTGTGKFYATSYNPGASSEVPPGQELNSSTDLQAAFPDVYNFVNGGGTGSLPVELTSFTGNVQDDQVILDWSTASQLNFSHFEVEHSNNANDWSVVTTLQGEGTTNELMEYSYTHVLPHNGRNYYRLRMVDLDETFEYSEIVTANVSANHTVFLSPNPSRGGTVRYEINFAPEEGDQLVVYDLVGGSVAAQNVLSFTGELVLPSTLTRGTYLVRYKGQAVNQVLRLVVE